MTLSGRVWLCTLLASAAVSCSHQARSVNPRQPASVCHRHYPQTVGIVQAHAWLALLVQLDLGRGGIFATRDCVGDAIRYVAPAACGSTAIGPPELTPELEAIGDESVIVRHVAGQRYIVWIITHRFANGEGYGPVALVEHEAGALSVQALGRLRMRSERVKLERWSLAGQALLAASGETCAAATKSCQRTLHVSLQRGTRLVELPVHEQSGACLQTADFELTRERELPLATGLHRRYELHAQVTHDAGQLRVEERMLVRDFDASAPLQPARKLQRIDMQRVLQARASDLFTNQPSLWNRVDAEVATPLSQQ
jgi:hypothetical protein